MSNLGPFGRARLRPFRVEYKAPFPSAGSGGWAYRSAGSALSKPLHLCRMVEGLTYECNEFMRLGEGESRSLTDEED